MFLRILIQTGYNMKKNFTLIVIGAYLTLTACASGKPECNNLGPDRGDIDFPAAITNATLDAIRLKHQSKVTVHMVYLENGTRKSAYGDFVIKPRETINLAMAPQFSAYPKVGAVYVVENTHECQ